MTFGVAIIGSGIFAKEEHLPAVKASSDLTLKALYSRSLKSAKALSEEAGGVDLYSDDSGAGKTYHDLLLREDIHAVIIALPILTQPEFIEAALLAGKHVLSEKPIAGDLKAAQKLISFYNTKVDKNKVSWSVAENFRFLESYEYAAQEVKKLGRILGFKVNVSQLVSPGGKYYETEWRKVPNYQGGFLLDGGVHTVAGIRFLLGEDKPTSLSAFTSLLQKHLPPVDTVDSIWQLKSGVSGAYSQSFGSTLSENEVTIAGDKGSVTVRRSTVIVREGEQKDEKKTAREFTEEGSGVKQEVQAWAEALKAGKPNSKQSPEEALADLEILEQMLKSGGKPLNLEFQT